MVTVSILTLTVSTSTVSRWLTESAVVETRLSLTCDTEVFTLRQPVASAITMSPMISLCFTTGFTTVLFLFYGTDAFAVVVQPVAVLVHCVANEFQFPVMHDAFVVHLFKLNVHLL